MKAYIWLKTSDGSTQQVEEGVAMYCPSIRQVICHKGVGFSKSNAVMLPESVNPATLSLVLDYCRFHQAVGHSDKELKTFDEKLVRMDIKNLCELASAAKALQLIPLADLTNQTIACIIQGKSLEEIREIFNEPDDLTEEEKLEPVKCFNYDPHARRLNRLCARKRKEMKEKEKMKDVVAKEALVDNRSVDDLLEFINGDDKVADSNSQKAGKSKKKNSKRKDQQKASSCHILDGVEKQEPNALPLSCEDSKDDGLISAPKAKLESSFNEPVSSKPEHSDAYDAENEQDSLNGPVSPMAEIDDKREDDYEQDSSSGHASSQSGLSAPFDNDELNPEMMEHDREVEDFDRRLSSAWADSERRNEM